MAALQSFTKIASEKVDQAKGAASSTKDKTTGTSKDIYNSVADKLQSARDASAKQLEDTRAAGDEQWAKLQKVQHSSLSSAVDISLHAAHLQDIMCVGTHCSDSSGFLIERGGLQTYRWHADCRVRDWIITQL